MIYRLLKLLLIYCYYSIYSPTCYCINNLSIRNHSIEDLCWGRNQRMPFFRNYYTVMSSQQPLTPQAIVNKTLPANGVIPVISGASYTGPPTNTSLKTPVPSGAVASYQEEEGIDCSPCCSNDIFRFTFRFYLSDLFWKFESIEFYIFLLLVSFWQDKFIVRNNLVSGGHSETLFTGKFYHYAYVVQALVVSYSVIKE